MEEIFTRRSIRRFDEKPVEKDKIDKLLRAAMQAPSAANQQPWEVIVVKDKQALTTLSAMSPYSKPVLTSGAALVLLANSRVFKVPKGWQQDMAAAAQNILLEATHLGLGSVWIGVATSDSSIDYIRDLYKLPSHILPFALIAIGYPDGQENEFIDRYKAKKVHYEKWYY